MVMKRRVPLDVECNISMRGSRTDAKVTKQTKTTKTMHDLGTECCANIKDQICPMSEIYPGMCHQSKLSMKCVNIGEQQYSPSMHMT
jgi:hypothetical protein